jgi:hypothetical protein
MLHHVIYEISYMKVTSYSKPNSSISCHLTTIPVLLQTVSFNIYRNKNKICVYLNKRSNKSLLSVYWNNASMNNFTIINSVL